MRVLHLEVPRGLSFTLKEWNGACHRELGGDWRQVDLNFDFWPWLLRDDTTGLYGKLVDLHYYGRSAALEVVKACVRELAHRCSGLESKVGLAGVHFPRRARASPKDLLDFLRSSPDRAFFADYFRHISQRFMMLSGFSFISLGVDSVDGLVFAGLLAQHIHESDADITVCLTRHQYENYSLVNRFDDIVREGTLLEVFDAIVRFEECSGRALAGLRTYFSTGKTESLTNVAVRTPQGILVRPLCDTHDPAGSPVDSRYVEDTLVPPSRLLYFAPLLHRACYYSRCSFCVQNERYLVRESMDPRDEVQRSVSAIERLARLGVSNFSFSDQALHPNTIRALARAASGGISFNWCGRMLLIPSAFDTKLVDALAQSGCREILFGAESLNPKTLRAMHKEFGSNKEKARLIVETLGSRGIDVVLSLIFGFPSESDEEFESDTLPFVLDAASRPNVTIILNRFALFRDTEIERSPADFGVVQIVPASTPFQEWVAYIDRFGRDSARTHSREAHYREAIQRASQAHPAASGGDADAAYVDYSSIGLNYRWRTRRYFPGTSGDGQLFSTRRDVLILGANSYIGQNLAKAVDSENLVLSSKSPRNKVNRGIDAPFVRANLGEDASSLTGLDPTQVYITSRPVGSVPANEAFARDLKTLLDTWVKRGRLRRIVFTSTQLVYPTPSDSTPIGPEVPIAPVAPYERFKADIEQFLGSLTAQEGVDVEVFRLPLVYGGLILPRQREQQLIPDWIDRLKSGGRWTLATEAERRFGNSWVLMPDLVQCMIRHRGPGLHIGHPVSGCFTYAELQSAVQPFCAPQNHALSLVRSEFFLRDTECLQGRDLYPLIVQDLTTQLSGHLLQET